MSSPANRNREVRELVRGGAALSNDDARVLLDSLSEYERCITWFTTCKSCARTLDEAYAQTCRAELAEAKLIRIRRLCNAAIADILVGETRLLEFARLVLRAAERTEPGDEREPASNIDEIDTWEGGA